MPRLFPFSFEEPRIIADNLSKAGWSYGYVSAMDPTGERSGLRTRTRHYLGQVPPALRLSACWVARPAEPNDRSLWVVKLYPDPSSVPKHPQKGRNAELAIMSLTLEIAISSTKRDRSAGFAYTSCQAHTKSANILIVVYRWLVPVQPTGNALIKRAYDSDVRFRC
jgi:hypothetical protein